MYIRVVSVQKLKILETKMKKGDWVVNYHADYCGHCQQMKPEWEKFVTKMKNNKNVNVADIESKMIPHMESRPNIMGYPTIKYYHNNKDIAEHNGERSCNGFEQFAKTNANNKVESKKEYPTLGNTLGNVDSSSKPMNDILKLFSAKLNEDTPKKVTKTKKTKKVKKSPSKAKKTKKSKKTRKSPSKSKKSSSSKAKKTRKTQQKIKPIKPVLKDKERKTTTDREIKLHTNVQVIKTPEQLRAEKKREKRKQQRAKKREQQKKQTEPGRQNRIIKNLKESIANIKDQAAKDKKLLNELSKQ